MAFRALNNTPAIRSDNTRCIEVHRVVESQIGFDGHNGVEIEVALRDQTGGLF